jgi:transposase-like protein
MLSAGQSSFPCENCGDTFTKVTRMTVTYETSIDLDVRETTHRHTLTTYFLTCPKCQHNFAVEEQIGFRD